MRLIIFQEKGKSEPRERLRLSLLREFEVTKVTETLNGSCNLSPPTQIKPIPEIQLSYCGVTMYKIPDDIFQDKEDDETKLVLTLYQENGDTIEANSIIQFDKSTKTVYGLLTSEYQPPSSRKLSYQLVVTDTSGQSTQTLIKFHVLNDKPKQIYNIKLITKFTPPSNDLKNADLVLAIKIGNYFSDKGKGFYLASSQVSTNAENVFIFGNCTWSTDICDVYKLKEYKSKIFTDGGVINPFFTSALSPEFQNIKINEIANPPCDKDQKPELKNPFKEIKVTSCGTKKFKIPEDTFHDPEQGSTGNLDLSVTLTSIQFGETEMLTLNKTAQTLIIVASDSDPVDSNFKLTATDISGKQAETFFTVTQEKEQKQPNHIVHLQFRISSSDLNNYVSLYSFVREKVKSFFGDTPSENTFQILQTEKFSQTYDVNTVHSIKWTNCSLPKDTCPKNAIDAMENRIKSSPQLSSILGSELFVIEMKITKSGICESESKHPEVINKIPDLNLGYCGPLVYQIPANTFKDVIDGDTRSLKLGLKFQNGSTPNNDFFLYFDEKTQTLYGTLIHTKNQFASIHINVQFQLIATNRRELATATQFRVIINENIKQISAVFSLDIYPINDDINDLNVVRKVTILSTQLSEFFQWDKSEFYVYEYEN